MDLERLKRAFAALLAPYIKRLDYLALYPAEVIKDHGDNHVDLKTDDQRLPQLVRVPLETFLPDVTVEVYNGARVLLGFAAGDPSKPRARLWDAGTVKVLKIKATTATVESETANVKGNLVNVDGNTVSLAGGGPPVARVGDQVATPVGNGVIIQGSSKVLCG